MQIDPAVLRALASQMERAAPERPELSWFRIIIGLVCAVVAVVFLSVNTWMLGRFGMRLGSWHEVGRHCQRT